MDHPENIVGPKYAIRYQADLNVGFLAWERPPYTHLVDLERKLRCTRCGNRLDNSLSVRVMPRN